MNHKDMGLPPSLGPITPTSAATNDALRAALDYARLLNEARILLTEFVTGCNECIDGKIPADDPVMEVRKGDDCPQCSNERGFLARCAKQIGPIATKLAAEATAS